MLHPVACSPDSRDTFYDTKIESYFPVKCTWYQKDCDFRDNSMQSYTKQSYLPFDMSHFRAWRLQRKSSNFFISTHFLAFHTWCFLSYTCTPCPEYSPFPRQINSLCHLSENDNCLSLSPFSSNNSSLLPGCFPVGWNWVTVILLSESNFSRL